MGASSQERYLHARMPGCTDPLFLAKMYVCHSEDVIVRQNDHHMMAIQMQLVNKWGKFGVYCVVYTTINTLSLDYDNH